MADTTNQFKEAVRKMREAQKGFFAAVYGSPERNKFLADSRKYEALVDKMLNAQEEVSLFSQE